MVQPHGAERVLEVLKKPTRYPTKEDLACSCLVARKDRTPCRAHADGPFLPNRVLSGLSSGTGGLAERLERRPGRRITLVAARHLDGVLGVASNPQCGSQHAAPSGHARPPLFAAALAESRSALRGPETKVAQVSGLTLKLG